MTTSLPYSPPTRAYAGDTIQWQRLNGSYYPTAGWSIEVTLRNAGAVQTFQSAPAGLAHVLTLTPAESALLDEGNWSLLKTYTNGIDRFTGPQNTIQNPPSDTLPADNRTHARKVLDAIEAVIVGTASSSTSEMTIAGRTLKHIPPRELLDLRDRYKQEVLQEEREAGQGKSTRVHVRFK